MSTKELPAIWASDSQSQWTLFAFDYSTCRIYCSHGGHGPTPFLEFCWHDFSLLPPLCLPSPLLLIIQDRLRYQICCPYMPLVISSIIIPGILHRPNGGDLGSGSRFWYVFRRVLFYKDQYFLTWYAKESSKPYTQAFGRAVSITAYQRVNEAKFQMTWAWRGNLERQCFAMKVYNPCCSRTDLVVMSVWIFPQAWNWANTDSGHSTLGASQPSVNPPTEN